MKGCVCKECGNRSKWKVTLCPNDDGEYDDWIMINCKKCGKCVFYNGA